MAASTGVNLCLVKLRGHGGQCGGGGDNGAGTRRDHVDIIMSGHITHVTRAHVTRHQVHWRPWRRECVATPL